jgi:8-oxo-dGTP diphosphatase
MNCPASGTPDSLLPPVTVVCAILERGGTILAAQRGPGQSNAGLWEFPGGKVHPGESPECALRREILEELGIEVSIIRPLAPVLYSYPWITIDLLPFVCTASAEPVPREHSSLKWVLPEEARLLKWSPADVPALENYCSVTFV